METQIAIVQFLFKSDWKVLSESLGANPALTSHKFDTAPDVLKFCATQQNCLVLANVSSKDDLVQLATFFKSAKKVLKSTVLKVVVLNSTENKQFEKAIGKLGSVEILEPSVNTKALRFKMDFWMKAMRAQSKKLGDLNKKTLEPGAQENSPEAKLFVQVPALECENDIWILLRESDCKRILGRWMIKFMGPGPYVGQWVEIPNKQNAWTFQIKKSFAENFMAGEGSWIFRGDQKPEFNWQENRWMMTGDAFELFFFDGKSSHVRTKVENKVLTLAANSLYAKTKESFIIESFDKELVFKNEAEVLRDQSLEFENEGDLGGHLEGKVKEKEESAKGHLEGKIKDRKESDKGNLEGKSKENDNAGKGHLEGKIKEKEQASKGHLEGKLKEKEESGKGHLEGKVEESESAKSPLQGKLKGNEPGEEKKPSEKHAQGNDHVASTWKGKTSDKGEAEAPVREDYNQHNEKLSNRWGGQVKENTFDASGNLLKNPQAKTDKAAAEEKERAELTDHLKSHWGGKGKSDSIDGKGASAPGSSDLKEGSLLALKQTDKEHQTHYKNHNEAKQYEAGELGVNKHEQEEGILGGKTSTDKLASHYGTGKKGQSSEAEAGPLHGAGETDRLASHLGRRNTEREALEKDAKDKPALSGKGQTEKLKGHYGSAKKAPASSESSDAVEEFEDVVSELEAAIDSPKAAGFENVLPFTPKAEEKELDALTESGKLSSFITQNGKRYECRLDDYFDTTIIFVCSAEGLRNSEKAAFEISLGYQGKNVQVKCDGIVQSLDQDGSGGFFVTIEIGSKDASVLDDFMVQMKSRQENIDTFLVKARGL